MMFNAFFAISNQALPLPRAPATTCRSRESVCGKMAATFAKDFDLQFGGNDQSDDGMNSNTVQHRFVLQFMFTCELKLKNI